MVISHIVRSSQETELVILAAMKRISAIALESGEGLCAPSAVYPQPSYVSGRMISAQDAVLDFRSLKYWPSGTFKAAENDAIW